MVKMLKKLIIILYFTLIEAKNIRYRVKSMQNNLASWFMCKKCPDKLYLTEYHSILLLMTARSFTDRLKMADRVCLESLTFYSFVLPIPLAMYCLIVKRK